MNKEGHRYIVVSDFDGTIVDEQVDFLMFAEYSSPMWEELENMRMDGKISYEDAMKGSVMSIKADISELGRFTANHMTARKGADEFFEYCRSVNIPFFIASAGLDLYVKQFVDAHKWNVAGIYVPSLKIADGRYSITFPDSPYSKGRFIERIRDQFGSVKIIFLGDGSLDIEAAIRSDINFARRKLAILMDEKGLKYYTFDTFYEVLEAVKNITADI